MPSCEKGGPLFWRFAQKLILQTVYNGRETNRLGYFYLEFLSLPSSLCRFFSPRDCRIVERREALRKTIFLRKAIQTPKNAEKYAPGLYTHARVGDMWRPRKKIACILIFILI